jgi:very-short-patch-repair endonuclease
MHPADLRLCAMANAQLYVITRRQALSVGLTDDQIRHRVRNGAFHQLFPGVYLTVCGIASFEQRTLAASLACGDGAHVSGITAAGLWGFVAPAASVIDVTVPKHRHPRLAGVRVHRRCLKRVSDRTRRGPRPITTHARTLLDLAGVLPSYDDLERAADEAFRSSTLTPDRLVDYLGRDDLANSSGIASLRSIAQDRARYGVPENGFENDALGLLRSFGLPEPVRQFRTRASGRRVRFDLSYPDQRVAIELDGRAPHWGRDAWQSDHDRHNATELDGWRVLRFTWWDVHDRPVYVVLTIATALGLRPRGWRRGARRRSPEASPR